MVTARRDHDRYPLMPLIVATQSCGHGTRLKDGREELKDGREELKDGREELSHQKNYSSTPQTMLRGMGGVCAYAVNTQKHT